mmetsp:Transcript_8562/g.21583  ORF Transcript_8562/g.21583 Transcript_8562/m.21583 type:complete len:153 (-) Transcript_8562:438-896(-)
MLQGGGAGRTLDQKLGHDVGMQTAVLVHALIGGGEGLNKKQKTTAKRIRDGRSAGGKATGGLGLQLLAGTVCPTCGKDVSGQPLSPNNSFRCKHCKQTRYATVSTLPVMMKKVQEGEERREFLKKHEIKDEECRAAARIRAAKSAKNKENKY